MTTPRDPAFRYAPLLWLALGAFAVGTEGFMIAAILPRISQDLAVSIARTGQLITIFALAYALSSPILTTLAGNVDRKRLLVIAMTAFATANLLAAIAPGYRTLASARVLLAFAAGVYVPSANALAGMLAAPAHRGRAIAIVNGGITIAIALGVPLGAVIGTHFGWRMTFVGVAALSVIAIVGIVTGLPRGVGAGTAVATFSQRLAVVRRPAVWASLLVTTLWAAGAYTVYTYIAPFLGVATGITGSQIGLVLFVWGASAGLGLFVGGATSDRRGPDVVIRTSLPVLAVALISLSLLATVLRPALAIVPVLAAIAVWGVAAWSFYPAQQTRLIGITGVPLAPIALSLNASSMYLGFSIGAALGSFTLIETSAVQLGWVGGTVELAALALFWVVRRPARVRHARQTGQADSSSKIFV